MLSKCPACSIRMITSGATYMNWKVCSEECVATLKVRLVEELIAPEVIDKHVQEFFHGECPSCGEQSPLDIYQATKITAFLIMFQTNTEHRVSCASCGRKQKLAAALYCFVAGWWGIKAAFCNVFIIPANLFGALMIRTPTEPSPELAMRVKGMIADMMDSEIAAAIQQSTPEEQVT